MEIVSQWLWTQEDNPLEELTLVQLVESREVVLVHHQPRALWEGFQVFTQGSEETD